MRSEILDQGNQKVSSSPVYDVCVGQVLKCPIREAIAKSAETRRPQTRNDEGLTTVEHSTSANMSTARPSSHCQEHSELMNPILATLPVFVITSV